MNVKRLGLMLILTLLVGLTALFAGVVLAGHTLNTVNEGEIPLLGPTWDHTAVTWSLKVSGGAPADASDAVREAMADWAHETSVALDGATIVLQEVSEGTDEDISIQVLGGGGKIAGSARRDLTADGFFESVVIKISGKSFGRENLADVIRSIVLHEVGHGVGLGHATSKQDAMYFQVQRPPVTQLSTCDIKAWEAAMEWLFATPPAVPALPSATSVPCGAGGPDPGPTGPLDANVEIGHGPGEQGPFHHKDRVHIIFSVKDASENPVDGATLEATLVTPKPGSDLVGQFTTDENGESHIHYKVNAGRDGRGTYHAQVVATAGTVTGECLEANPCHADFVVE